MRAQVRLLELPPRARRIHINFDLGEAPVGTTSACAENTKNNPCSTKNTRNYLRVRGEYPWNMPPAKYWPELPPRARRIRFVDAHPPGHSGTTSACAENTQDVENAQLRWGNYLRVRGEYCFTALIRCRSTELPPRARRIPPQPPLGCTHHGTTSACAENTRYRQHPFFHAGNYLRVRGEYTPRPANPITGLELPPRARRIQFTTRNSRFDSGTTSACAENTGNP